MVPDYVILKFLWCSKNVNSQRFCRGFMVPQECQLTEILQSFYDAVKMPINKNFANILWYPKNVN